MKSRAQSTFGLLAIVALNYIAQIPYYLRQYYFPHHQAPSPIGVVLLGITLLWFVVGYSRYVAERPHGFGILLGFVLTQVLFYGHSVVLGLLTGGGAEAQLTTHSHFLVVVFSIGYVDFLVAVYYIYWLLRHGRAVKVA